MFARVKTDAVISLSQTGSTSPNLAQYDFGVQMFDGNQTFQHLSTSFDILYNHLKTSKRVAKRFQIAEFSNVTRSWLPLAGAL